VLILAGTLLALVLVPLTGGRLGRLAEVRLASRWVVAYALALQVLVISVVPDWPRPVVVALHASSYALAAVFVWLNRDVAGLPVLALGAGLNAFAIAVNGGQMPASATALARVGITQDGEGYVNSGVVEHPRFGVLGDVLASPSSLPLQNVYSVGDLFVLAGAVWLVHRTCGTVLARDPRPVLRSLRRLPQAWALAAELTGVPAQRRAPRTPAVTPSAGR
jgi:hypothetical protein